MDTQGVTPSEQEAPDPAAILGAAISLHNVCEVKNRSLGLTEYYGGGDEIMRYCMRIATAFEEWACRHVAFDELEDIWPYLLQEAFGDAVESSVGLLNFHAFSEDDCVRVATHIGTPVYTDEPHRDAASATGMYDLGDIPQ